MAHFMHKCLCKLFFCPKSIGTVPKNYFFSQCFNPIVVKAYENDPLVHGRVTARFFTELMAAMESVNQQASLLNVPVLMQVAGEDYIVNADSSKHFFEKLTLQDKTLHVYDGLYHEIYNAPEDQKERVLEDLEAWLDKHI